MKIGIIRQGDVLLCPVDVPSPPEANIRSKVVLVLGEVTGHAHVLEAPEVLDWSVAGQRYVRVVCATPGTITHEDHDPVPAVVIVPEVTYQVVQQKECDLSKQWRKVVD